MTIAGTAIAIVVVICLVRTRRTRAASGVAVAALLGASLLTFGGTASAYDVAAVPLGTAAGYSVMASSTVTNDGSSVLDGSIGLAAPGTSVTGFPPGQVLAPATIQISNGTTVQAKTDLQTAYTNAANRPIDETVASDLVDLTLAGGVYAAQADGPLLLTGELTLDAAGVPGTVWIFKTDSTLITGGASSINLIGGAQACNVFWQVGSSATLGAGSDFVGTILASEAITVETGVDVQGRALALNKAVTLDTNDFTTAGCAAVEPPASTSTTLADTTTTAPAVTTTAPGPTTTEAGPTTTVPGPTTTTPGPTTTVPGPTTTVAGPTTTEVSPATTIPGPVTTIPAPVTTSTPSTATTVGTAPPGSTTTVAPAPPTTVDVGKFVPPGATAATAVRAATTTSMPATEIEATTTIPGDDTATAGPTTPKLVGPPQTGAGPSTPATPFRDVGRALLLGGPAIGGLLLLRRDPATRPARR